MAHLAKEKELTRLRDELSRERRELPWVKVEKNYVFDGPDGKETLADLFDGRSQLIVYHFMFDPEWSQGCKSCSFVADHYNPAVVHLAHRDVTMVTVSKAPIEKIEAFQQAHGLDVQVGVVVRQRLRPRLPRVVHGGGAEERAVGLQLRPQAVPDQRAAGDERVREGRRRGTSSTPIRPTPAAWTSSWARTTCSTSCPRAATRTGCRAWPGCGTTTATATRKSGNPWEEARRGGRPA